MIYLRIKRFIDAQKYDHDEVMKELKKGKKISCWMWYTFPQIKGLGHSEMAKYYEIQSRSELRRFASHPYLAKNLEECIKAILRLSTNNPVKVFGIIDAQKLQSSMTLFLHSRKFKYLAQRVLNKYFKGIPDAHSEALIQTL